jgi:hypothetical protein
VNRTQCPRLRLGSRCVSRCDGYHKKALLPPRRTLPRYPPLDPCTTLALLGEQPLARQFFVAPFALLVPAVRGLPAFCGMRADAFGPRIEMAAQTEHPGAQRKYSFSLPMVFCYGDCRGQRPEWRRQIEGA